MPLADPRSGAGWRAPPSPQEGGIEGEGAPATRKHHGLPKAEPMASPHPALACPHPNPLPPGRGSPARLCRSRADLSGSSPSSPDLIRGSTSWQRGGSQDVGGRTKSGHDGEGSGDCVGDVKQPAPVGPEPLGSEPVVRSRVARRAARLDDAWCDGRAGRPLRARLF